MLDELGVADNTIVMYSTDNGPHMNSWPDAGMTPFRNEKDSNWEGAFRVPWLVRWPGVTKPGSECNEIVAHLDWLPTLLAAAGEPDIKERLQQGHQVGDKTFKVHLDGYNFLPYFKGEAEKPPRVEYLLLLRRRRPDGIALRQLEARVPGAAGRRHIADLGGAAGRSCACRRLFNLRTDPYERADITSNTYYDWMIDHVYLFVPAQRIVGEFLSTFIEYPPRQKAASFSIDQVMEKLSQHGGGSH